jgi:hypothetical protein
MQKIIFEGKHSRCKNLTKAEKTSSFADLQDMLSDWWLFDNYIKERLKSQGITT